MTVIFFIPLVCIGVYEAELDPAKNQWVKEWLLHPDQGLGDSQEHRDPEVDDEGLAEREYDPAPVARWFVLLAKRPGEHHSLLPDETLP